jgi:hypothetical protein
MYVVLYTQQDRQCTYNVTVWCSQAAVALEKQKVLHMMSVCLHSCLSYPACKLLLFSVIVIICSLQAVPYFSHYLINSMMFRKNKFNMKCVF